MEKGNDIIIVREFPRGTFFEDSFTNVAVHSDGQYLWVGESGALPQVGIPLRQVREILGMNVALDTL